MPATVHQRRDFHATVLQILSDQSLISYSRVLCHLDKVAGRAKKFSKKRDSPSGLAVRQNCTEYYKLCALAIPSLKRRASDREHEIYNRHRGVGSRNTLLGAIDNDEKIIAALQKLQLEQPIKVRWIDDVQEIVRLAESKKSEPVVDVEGKLQLEECSKVQKMDDFEDESSREFVQNPNDKM
ncbi:hypothetical protein GGS21DRAFT_400309 [Xylaria nigripes]|nr:hypothetical protein GGS21DRAFT_400309 [Xylaria nigripes]